MSCTFTPAQVNEAFLASPPLLASSILDFTIQSPNWLRDLWQLENWPLGQGTIMEQLVFRGEMPQIERGFDKWKKIGNISGCDPCEAPDCNYNWGPFGGHGINRIITQLMERDFRTPNYCIAEIQTTAHFREVFAKIVENLFAQIDYFKAQNIGFNYLTSVAKKYVVDSEGPKANTENPYVYRNTGGVRLATLNIDLLEFFYEAMTRIPDVIPYDVVDGAPIYALMAGRQLLSRMYRDNDALRQDVRFSGLANDLVTKYNFMSTIRGMFIAAPIMTPRRFNIVAGEPVEVFPDLTGIPAEVGSYAYPNPAYEAATHEEVLLHGKWPFKIWNLPTETTLGEGTSFGPEYSFMQNWIWVNPLTDSDPFRRTGYFATSAKIGLANQYSSGIFAILVERPTTALTAMYTPNGVCPVAPPTCDNVVPEVGCPCPCVMSITANPFDTTSYYFTFGSAITGEAEEEVILQLDNGLTITGTLVQISADGLTAEITFTDGLDKGICSAIVGVSCGPTPACSAIVEGMSDCRSDQSDAVKLALSNAIRADVGEDIYVYFGDCTTALLTILSIDAENLIYTVQYAAGYGPTEDPTGAEGYGLLSADMVCDRKGISKVCVPPATDATCPACEFTLEVCEEEEIG